MSESIHSQIENTLRDLDTLLPIAPDDVARHAERIRFAAIRLNQLVAASAVAARIDIALEILDRQLQRADAFIDAAVLETELLRVA